MRRDQLVPPFVASRYLVISLLVVAVTYGIASCDGEKDHTRSSKQVAEKLPEKETRYFATENPQYNKIGNPRFNFWIDLPVSWRAFDRSANGDGYFIDVGDPDVDFRAYGSNLDLGKNPEDSEEFFTFRDGKTGKKRISSNGYTFVRASGGQFLYVHVSAPNNWLQSQKQQIEHVAGRLRSGDR